MSRFQSFMMEVMQLDGVTGVNSNERDITVFVESEKHVLMLQNICYRHADGTLQPVGFQVTGQLWSVVTGSDVQCQEIVLSPTR